ncbi:MAG: D-alanyl-D-alanine carboxypeptidase/D-alanyl-D-alanine-endopeptidase [Candidatus Binatia bacterium]
MTALRALCALCVVASTARADHLAERLDAALRHPGFRGARVGALVVRAEDGRQLFARNSATPMVPASNMKLITALAALATFGPTYRFTTEVYADSAIGPDGSVGALAIRGGGDPALTSEELWRLAANLRRGGLRRVRGDLLLDDSYFDAERWNPAWGGASARAYHAPVSALTANYGAFAIEVVPPSSAAGRARINVDPPLPFFQLVDKIRTGGKTSLTVDRSDDGPHRVTIDGSVRHGDIPIAIHRSVSDPTRYTAAVLRMQLAAVGIAIDGADRPGVVPAGFTRVLAFEGKPLAEVVGLMMKWSNNNIAEMLVKAMGAHGGGAPGTWVKGLLAVRGALNSLGVDQTGLDMFDGSGLASNDRVTPRTLVSALHAAHRSFAFGPEFAASLPIAGRDGTLRGRARNATDLVRAKTGLLTGAAALSGYARSRDGTELMFAILNNGADMGDAEARAANDAFAEALVQ